MIFAMSRLHFDYNHYLLKGNKQTTSVSEVLNIKCVFLLTTKNAFIPAKRDYSMNTYSWISIKNAIVCD